MRTKVTIAILMTCHNRKSQTLACLGAVFLNKISNEYSLEIFLVDDGSTDGTELSVRETYPQVHVIKGDGNLYWNGGMHMAFSAAMKLEFDFYLWLNDDAILFPDTLGRMLKITNSFMQEDIQDVIVVGTMQAKKGGSATYGGLTRVSRWKPLKFDLLSTFDEPVACDTMNGNCVLIPSSIANKVGNLDATFKHAMGDIDYGLRARKLGFRIMLLPNYAGICSRNSLTNTHYNTSLSRFEKWKKITSDKELPVKPWFVLTKRHAGLLWPIYWAWPYVKVLLR